MKIKKIIASAALSLTLFCSIFAESAFFQDENYSISLKYNNEIVPGDAVFVRMNITQLKAPKKSAAERRANLQLFQNGKLIESSPFYFIKKNKNGGEMLSGVPVSLWIEAPDNTYELKVIFSFAENQAEEFKLPVVYSPKKFNQENIPLDQKNTEIRTDTSPERMAQIEKLNNIFFTTMPNDVYFLKSFICPTTSTRYTANCGDRRTYVYADGKTSTTLHFGNDYGIPTGSEVKSCADGRVVMAENRISTGWSIVIEHLPGLYSVYYHMSELLVKEGDMVKQNQVIGKSGATGMVTGPHLHWEMRLNGSAVVPEFFMKDFTFEE